MTALIVALVCAVLYILWLFKVIVDDGKTIDFMNKVNADVIKLNGQLKEDIIRLSNKYAGLDFQELTLNRCPICDGIYVERVDYIGPDATCNDCEGRHG